MVLAQVIFFFLAGLLVGQTAFVFLSQNQMLIIKTLEFLEHLQLGWACSRSLVLSAKVI